MRMAKSMNACRYPAESKAAKYGRNVPRVLRSQQHFTHSSRLSFPRARTEWHTIRIGGSMRWRQVALAAANYRCGLVICGGATPPSGISAALLSVSGKPAGGVPMGAAQFQEVSPQRPLRPGRRVQLAVGSAWTSRYGAGSRLRPQLKYCFLDGALESSRLGKGEASC